jgi:uncharacterized protein YdaU (DUF1376 family)
MPGYTGGADWHCKSMGPEVMHHYQHNIKTFNSATRHLTRVERSLYRDLIELYYDSEKPLPADNFDRLARLVLANSDEEKQALLYVLSEFFTKCVDVYTHAYCDEQIEKFYANTTAKALAGKASARARQEKQEQRKRDREQQAILEFEQNPAGVQRISTNQEPVTSNQEPIINTSAQAPSRKAKPDYPDWFTSLWIDYPPRAGSNDKRKAFQAASARLKDGYTIEQLQAATYRYRAYVLATGKQNTEYVKQAASFYGPGGHIDNEWRIPNGTNSQSPSGGGSAIQRPFAEQVQQQARNVIERINGNAVYSDSGGGTVCPDGSVVSEQGQIRGSDYVRQP